MLYRALIVLLTTVTGAAAQARQVVWTMDRLDRIGGHPTTIVGAPQIVDGPLGKAIAFDGVKDSILVDGRPLVRAKTFTIEATLRPEAGGFEQRFLHIAETDPTTGRDSIEKGTTDPTHRIMFELRVEGDTFYVDGFLASAAGQQALATPDKLHPIDRWHVLAQTYDGSTYRLYVDGVLQGAVKASFVPQGPGRVRLGARMNGISHFHGKIGQLRFTDRVLNPQQMLRLAKKDAR